MSTINFEKAIAYVKSLPAVPDSALTPDVIIKWDKSKSTHNEWGGKTIETTPVFYYPKMGIVNFLKEAQILIEVAIFSIKLKMQKPPITPTKKPPSQPPSLKFSPIMVNIIRRLMLLKLRLL